MQMNVDKSDDTYIYKMSISNEELKPKTLVNLIKFAIDRITGEDCSVKVQTLNNEFRLEIQKPLGDKYDRHKETFR